MQRNSRAFARLVRTRLVRRALGLGLGTLLFALSANPLLGQLPADTFHLPGIVVTATGEATQRALLPQSVTILDGADLRERGVVFLKDALEEVAGIHMVQTGSLGGTTSAFLRGGNSNFVKVLLDGVPLNEPGGRFDFGSFTLHNIERIEVVRGPASVLYGSDAVSGVIHLFTRRGSGEEAPALTSAALQAGTLGTWSGELGARGATERTRWTASLGRTASDGVYEVNNRFTSLTGSGRVELLPDERTRLALSLRLHESQYNFPTDGSGEIVDLNQFNFDDGAALSLEAHRAFTPALSGRLIVRSGRGERGFENESDTPADTLGFGYAGERLGTATRRGADARLSWRGASTTLTGGVDWEVERERLFSRTESNFGGGASVSASAFTADRWNLAGYGQLEVAGPVGSRLSLGGRADQNEAFGSFLTGQAGAVVPLPGFGRLRAQVGSAFKAPSFAQQFADTPFERGNGELEPETSTSVEGGWDAGFLENRLTLSASLFRQEFRELIVYENRGAALPTYYNESRARASGTEVGVHWRGHSGLTLAAEFTRIRAVAVDDEFDDGDDAARLLRRPDHHLAGRLRVPLSTLVEGSSFGVTLNRMGTRVDNDFSTWPSTRVTLEAYTTADLDFQLPAGGFLWTLRLENAFDAAYVPVVGFPGKGRMVFLGARWNP